MKVVIIEDELNVYKRLSRLVKETFEHSTIVAHLDSVESAKEWFAHNSMPDIVFIDINLGDGTGFDVLNLTKIDCPYVFTTAYDEYAIDAFQTNSIAYLLKPITKEDLEVVVKKLGDYHKMFNEGDSEKGKRPGAMGTDYKTRFIIRYGEHMKILQVEEIAYCFTLNKATFIRTFDNRTYNIEYTLDVLEEALNPKIFFRINRQYIICIKAIKEMRVYSKARILMTLEPPTKDQQLVTTERSADFKQWLAGEY